MGKALAVEVKGGSVMLIDMCVSVGGPLDGIL